jgi:putative peptidoglycan lipid II flippase
MARDPDDASELVATHATDAEEAPAAVAAPPAQAPARGSGRGAMLVTAGILMSRLFGLVRQRIVGHYFGISAFADVIAAAFRIGNITQNLLGEGTLSASFIPVYAKARASGRDAEATRFALTALGFLLLAAGTASTVGVALAPVLTRAIAPGFEGERLELTTNAVRVLFPMTGLLVLSAWGLGVLNAHRRFFLPYAAPVLWSVAQIVALLVFGEGLGKRGAALLAALVFGALAGAALQLIVLLPAARALLGSLRPRLDRSDPHLREAVVRLPNALLGRGVIQLSSLIDTALVSFLGTGAQAAMNAAQLVYLLPMSVLGTGEAAAALPDMASETADDDVERRNARLRARLGGSLTRVTTLTVPATLVLALLGGEVTRVLLQSGKFDAAATEHVERVVFAYAFALLGNASARVLTTTSWAIGDTKTPARYAVWRVAVSTVGSLLMMQWFDVVGVVLGAVAAAWVETFALGRKLGRQIGGLGLSAIPFARIAALGAISIAPALALKLGLPAEMERTLLGSAAVLAVFGVAFAVAAPALGLFDVRAVLRRRG